LRKSTGIKIGVGGMLSVTFTTSTFLIGTFLPSAELVTVAQARTWTLWGFLIIPIGIIVSLFLWIVARRVKASEDKSFISEIPEIIDNIHERRGQYTQEYEKQVKDTKSIEIMNKEVFKYLSGYDVPEQLNDENVFALLKNVVSFITEKPQTELTDEQLAYLVAGSASSNLPIQAKLEKDRIFRKYKKVLKYAENALSKTAVDAVERIGHYLTYSEAYWAVDVILWYITNNAMNINPMMATAYQIYKTKFEKQMELNKAAVCEVVNG